MANDIDNVKLFSATTSLIIIMLLIPYTGKLFIKLDTCDYNNILLHSLLVLFVCVIVGPLGATGFTGATGATGLFHRGSFRHYNFYYYSSLSHIVMSGVTVVLL